MVIQQKELAIDIDVQRTAAHYANLSTMIPDYLYNEHYLPALEHMRPEDKSAFAALGIDLRKVADASCADCSDREAVLYDCIAFVSGKIMRMTPKDGMIPPVFFRGYDFCVQEDGFYPSDQPLPHAPLQMSFQLRLPWACESDESASR